MWVMSKFPALWFLPIISMIVGFNFNIKNMIKTIIVHLNDAELTSQEFATLADFLASDLYKGETTATATADEVKPTE